jgi:hypothetical protein
MGTSPTITAPVQNLLGINKENEAAGFWTDNNGKEHQIKIDTATSTISSLRFIEISLRLAISPTTVRSAFRLQ